jgi:hypothetical protein
MSSPKTLQRGTELGRGLWYSAFGFTIEPTSSGSHFTILQRPLIHGNGNEYYKSTSEKMKWNCNPWEKAHLVVVGSRTIF